MSYKLTQEKYRHSRATGTTGDIAGFIAERTIAESRVAEVRLAEIAVAVDRTEAVVRRHLKLLVELGEIEPITDAGRGGFAGGRGNARRRYHVDFRRRRTPQIPLFTDADQALAGGVKGDDSDRVSPPERVTESTVKGDDSDRVSRVKGFPSTETPPPIDPPTGKGRGRQRRRRRRDRGTSASARPAVACPRPGLDPGRVTDLDAVWAVAIARARQELEGRESAFVHYLAPLHIHDRNGDGLIIGAPPRSDGWVRDRFGRLLTSCAGAPVVIVPCEALHG